MRRVYFLLIALGVLVFLAVSLLLARVFNVDGAERTAITGLVAAEARGDVNGMIERIERCAQSQACLARVSHDAATLTRRGNLAIIELQTSAGFSLTSTLGTARVAWTVNRSLPIVQCVRVRRAGDVIRGLRVQLLAISARIPSDADCPARF